jgi:hypothetical protein
MQTSPTGSSNHQTSVDISTWELLTLPIAPGFVTIARKVTQGYFLTFSNLCSGTFTFRLLIVIPSFDSSPSQCDGWQDRELTLTGFPGAAQVDPSGIGNHQSVLDITGGTFGNLCQTDFGELTYLGTTNNKCAKLFLTNEYKICGGWSGLWTLLPNLDASPGGPNLVANGKFEVRGWAAMGAYEAETKKIDLLVNAERRATYYPASLQTAGDPVNLADLDQTANAIESATGRSAVQLEGANNISVQFTTKVKKWADVNGVALDLIAPFAHKLDCLL